MPTQAGTGWRPATLVKIIFCLSLAGLCGAFFFIRSETFLAWVEGRLEGELRNHITDDWTVDVGEIKGNIFGSVTLGSVSISKGDAPNPPVISTGKVVLKYNLFSLLTRRFEVRALQVSAPQIHIVRNPDGSLNLTHILKKQHPTQASSAFDVAVERIRWNRGRITYLDTQDDFHIALNDISLSVNGKLNTWDHKGNLRIDKGHWTFNGTEIPIHNFDADFVLSETDGSRLKDFYFTFGNSALRIKGGFRKPGQNRDPVWDADLDLELDVSDVQQFFGDALELEGTLEAQLAAEGTDSTLDVKTFSARMPAFSMRKAGGSQKIAMAALAVDAHFKSSPAPTLEVTTLHADIAEGTLSGEGRIRLKPLPAGDIRTHLKHLATHPFRYSGHWRATDIQIIPLLSMFVPLPEYLSDGEGILSGTATFDGTRSDLSTLKLDSEMALTQTTLNTVALEDSRLKCTVEDGTLKVNGNFDSTAIAITAPFPMRQQDTLDIQATGIHVDTLTQIANAPDLGGVGTASAKVSADGSLEGVLAVPAATFNDIPLGVLTGNYRYEAGTVFIEKGMLTKRIIVEAGLPSPPIVFPPQTERELESRTTIQGSVAVKDDFPADIRIVADSVYVQHYPRLLLGAEYPVTGELKGELKLEGSLLELDGRANFSVTDGVAWGIHLDPLRLPLHIENYTLRIPNFKITTRGQQLTLNVAVAPTGDFDLLLESERPVSFQEVAKAANIPEFPFEGHFDVRVIGSLRAAVPPDFRVELDFSDITYLDGTRGKKHLLGDVSLLGQLLPSKNATTDADIYDFQGHGFDGTSHIRGTVSTAVDTPYHFVVESHGIEVSPFLRPLHPMLHAITGTADGRVWVSGTLADLAPAPPPAEPRPRQIYPYTVDIHIATTQLRYENSTGHGTPFTTAEPTRLHLKDDKWTIDTLSLRTSQDPSAFLELAGTFDAKTEVMDLHARADGFALPPLASVFGIPNEVLHAGIARYALHITGTPTLPVVAVEGELPTLTLKTAGGDVSIRDARWGLVYQDNVLRLDERCAFEIFGNAVHVGGYIDVHPETVDTSELHLRVDTIALDLTTLPMAGIDEGLAGNGTTGVLEASLEIGGTLAEPHAILYAETAAQQPIRLASYIPSITLERFRVDIDIDSEWIHIQTVEAEGRMGMGPYRAEGEAVFSRQSTDTLRFALEVSASQVEIGDYGIVSGTVQFSGTGLTPHQMTVIGKLEEVVLDGYDLHLTNTAPIQFRSDPGASVTGTEEPLAVEIPLQITSPAMRASVRLEMGGRLDAPTLTAAWNGTLHQKEWSGNVQYSNRQIEVVGITLKEGAHALTLTGGVPFDLTFAALELPERLLTEPITLRLRGSELPLDFFPGVRTHFSEIQGTVDIDVALIGTSRSPSIAGNVSVEAPRLVLKNFHEPIRNLRVHLAAREDVIDIKNFQFEMGAGNCRLQAGHLILHGIVPEEFRLTDIRFERFPLGSMLATGGPPEGITEVQGHLTARLETLRVPLDPFWTRAATLPLPSIQEVPSLVQLVTVSTASFSMERVRLAFKAFDRHYDFQNPQPVSILLREGTVALADSLRLEDQQTFSIKQTFSAEDAKPEGLLGDERIRSGRTTLRMDAGSRWKPTDGEFDVALRVADFDVSALTAEWPRAYRLTGALSGTLQMSGTSEAPKITLRRHVSDPAELYLHDIPIDLRWRVRYQNGNWEISKKRYVEVTFGENLLTFSWTMPYQLQLIPFLKQLQLTPEKVWKDIQQTPMEGILDIKVKDLSMLPLLVSGLGSATGESDIHVELIDTLEAPQASGSVFFNRIAFEFPDAGISVKEVEGNIHLSEKGATLTELAGNLNDGHFSMKGSITAPPDRRIWQTPPVLDVSASVTEGVFEQVGGYKANLDFAELRLHGELLRPDLTGSLRINGGYYQQNWESVRDWLTGVSIKEADVALANPILQELHLDVDVDIPGDFRVLSSITGPTDIEIACFGKLIGPIHQPVFSGDVSVQRGKIGLITQPFEFVEGSIVSNRNTFSFNPDLNIVLRTPERIRGVLPRDESLIDVQVYAAVTGTLNNPNFTLSAPTETTSEVLTHEDILAFLIRNATLSGKLGGWTFSVQRPFEEDARSIIAEYPLRENMSIKIETNDRGEHGIDVEFKGRF